MLKLKAKCLFIALSVLIALPILPLLFLSMIFQYIPFLSETSRAMLDDSQRMLAWREDTMYWFVKDRQRGYSLTID